MERQKFTNQKTDMAKSNMITQIFYFPLHTFSIQPQNVVDHITFETVDSHEIPDISNNEIEDA